MKNFTKILSMVLLVAMCMSMLTVSAFADGTAVACSRPGCNGYIGTTLIKGTAATCNTEGVMDHYVCTDPSCGRWYAKSDDASSHIMDASVAALGHDYKHYEAKAATCTEPGNNEYRECQRCGQLFDKNYTVITEVPVLNALGHNRTAVEAKAATCTEDGNIAHKRCSACGGYFDADGNVLNSVTIVATGHQMGAWVVTTEASTTAAGEETSTCTVCGTYTETRAINMVTFSVSGTQVQDISTASSLTYTVSNPGSFTITSISVGGKNLTYGAGYTYDSTLGIITLDKAAIAALLGDNFSAALKFNAKDTANKSVSAEGFTLTNSAKQVVNNLQINGVGDMDYIKGSDLDVHFQTNSELQSIKLYDINEDVVIGAVFSRAVDAVYGMYTYTFDNAFLDNLDCHKYQIRCYYSSADNSAYKSAGYLNILESNTTVDKSLKFDLSELGSDKLYKYISGSDEPRIYCPLFTISGARLQVKTDATGWSDVNVYNYYIEQKNGEDTAWAFIDDAYLNTLDSDNNYYFRVMVPASKMGTSESVTSNFVTLQVGATLRPVDTAKHVINSTKNLRFVCSEEIAEVYVGNIQLTSDDDFAVSTNKKTVTLSADFLNKRTAGSTYTIKVKTTDGEWASTTFQILTTAQASASPRTGDTSNLGLWAAVLMLSAGAAVAVLPRLKKEN